MSYIPLPSSNDIAELHRWAIEVVGLIKNSQTQSTVKTNAALSVSSSSIGSSVSTVTTHTSLIGRDALAQHPASSIINTPYGNITATDIQNAINQEDTNLTSHVTTLYTAHGLPTWTGNVYISSVGTITHGTWNGSVIQDSYIASSSTWNAKQTHYANLDSIGALTDAIGWLHNNGSGTFSYSTPSKSDIGLGNVENTALSTWSGSSYLSTLGTITTGVWHGTAIEDTYIYSASRWNSLATFPGFSNSNPSNLGTASPGIGAIASRYDHVHQMPSYSDIGAAASNATTYIGTTQISLGASSGTYTSLSVNITGNLTGVASGLNSTNDVTVNSITVGRGAGNSIYNAVFGYLALPNNTTGIYNTAVGAYALNADTSGQFNTAVGTYALGGTTLSDGNTAVGCSALLDCTNVYNNTAVGYTTGRGIVSGHSNTILGANVTGLASDLSNNIIIAIGDGTIKAQYNGTDWNFTCGSFKVNGSPIAGGSGTVTSVGLSMPSIFTVTNSPVTSSGTMTATLNTQSAKKVFAGPASGVDAAPTFRQLSSADLSDVSTVGAAFFGLTNPSAITFPLINADNSVAALSASDFRAAIGAGTGVGVSTSPLSGDGTASDPYTLANFYGLMLYNNMFGVR